ncbi:MAG: hypothetical protein GY729_05685 [Desulfobacteraceae bacterium]|nr:hypothetical protein [Desulfobacteraceae bacterium]
MIKAYNMKIAHTPFFKTHAMDLPQSPEIEFKPDMETIRKIKGIFY